MHKKLLDFFRLTQGFPHDLWMAPIPKRWGGPVPQAPPVLTHKIPWTPTVPLPNRDVDSVLLKVFIKVWKNIFCALMGFGRVLKNVCIIMRVWYWILLILVLLISNLEVRVRDPHNTEKNFFFFTKIHVNFLKNCVNFSNKNYHRFSSKITWTQAQTACHVIFVENLWFLFVWKITWFFWKSLKQKLVSSLVRTFYIKQSSYKSTSKYEFNRPRLKFW